MLLDANTLKKSSVLDPKVVEYFDANPRPPLDWDDWQSVRNALQAMSKMRLAALGPAESAIQEEYKQIPMRDGFQSKIKIYSPSSRPVSGSPLIVFFYGGGFIGGDVESSTAFARAFVRLFGATVVAPSYRLAPEHKFPTPQYDAWDSLKWLAQSTELGVDFKQGFVVCGSSAGAVNAVTCVTHALEEKLTHPITGQYLSVPSIMDKNCVPEKFKPYFLSHGHNAEAPILPGSALDSIARHTSEDMTSPWRFCIISKAPLSELPPTYIQVDGADPLRDEGLIYDEMLKEAGVKVKTDFYPGCPHAHFSFMPGLDVTNKAIADTMIGVGWLLGREITVEEGLGAMVAK